jgi:transglycosylase-like protein
MVATVAVALPAAALAADTLSGRKGDPPNPRISVLDRPEARLMKSIEVELRQIRRQRFAQLPGGVSRETLEAIAACESGGDPTIVSADGSYRGKYQFSVDTWASVGGSGDPAAAPEAEQDYRAALLYAQSGSSPWPVCGV